MNHYHVTVTSEAFSLAPITVGDKYKAFAEFGKAVMLLHDVTGLRVNYWDNHNAIFEDGSTVRWRACSQASCAPTDVDPKESEREIHGRDPLTEAYRHAQDLTIFLRKTISNRDGFEG